ncbi:hypothetical protein BABINDRAFT_162730 [Babjeviella inositovora NRRL Y-12698]|uniref:Oxo-4-hydroxy-4-carboxy-5-ureidoimidazoline decarboxylase domain-containing protein n=1 Tax=Babjeviella inositovora NRRL Y-12698 TaxID=984486 RepID=A0A1E3QLF8_9ASCO|nr:uncharacterized protein BABINDRAFT_162730 [Babjeviella inositovora NRRL Y-12698]ODQ78525.1 hypothetical protein BABINDRAFT_162730 [Babjeviella inositovora NRRL Y-12698]
MSYSLPQISEISHLNEGGKDEFLGHLFEPCSTLNAFLRESNVFKQEYLSYKAFIESCRSELLAFLASPSEHPDPRISQIIAAHPRLGGGNAKKLSLHSEKEQQSLQSSPEELAKLMDLNEQYERTFPGLRYVVFVNGRSRAVVMHDMETRIAGNDIAKERIAAFNAMCDIALDRAEKLETKL